MSEFASGVWDLYIALVTIVSIVACAVFLKSQSVRKVRAEGETTGHTWDEDLAEYNNPLPKWWSWLFYVTIVFSLIYLVLYPGLGTWPGTLGWSQVGQLKDEQSRAEKQFGPIYQKFATIDVEALKKNPEALAIGQKLFLNNCAQCHASDGAGSRGFPNLTAAAWQWGGDVKTIKTTIAEGRTGVMPPFGASLGEQGVKNVAQYVRSLSGLTADSIRVALGKDIYMQNCVACHGADGKGNPALGAPNLTDKNWLHGSTEPVVIETITKGRTSQMPAHKTVLDEARIHLLTAYVLSLSK
ncbi:MAG TPA: cytochrome-c oxidase, cbb3-type subunit III [Burkholderiales bacterium]|nr:cytochrome-c oxidase, cbb3-type subunit III [Burkholderiales bacterium]